MGRIIGKELAWAMVVFLGPITFGAIICYPSPTAKEIKQLHHLSDDSLLWSFYNSVSSLFAISGPFLTRVILNCFHSSRRQTVFVISLMGVIFWLLNCLTKINIWAGIVVRAFLGIVMGANSCIAPMYLVEIAPDGSSGFFGCLNQIGIVVGIVLFDFIGPSLTYFSLNFVGASICLLQSILIFFIAESPAVNNEYQVIMDANEEAKDQNPSLCRRKNMPGLISGVTMMFLQQFSGINAILTNLATIMDDCGLSIDGNYQAGIASTAQLIAVIIGAFIMDKFGRKMIWIVSCGIIIVFLLIFALNEKYKWSKILPLFCIFIYQLGFGLGMGPIPWFIIPEYFDNLVRPSATIIVTASNWIFAFLIIFIWPAMKKSFGFFGSLLFFMGITVGSFLFGIFVVHEPKSKKSNN